MLPSPSLPSALARPLTRAANLCDFDGLCPSVAVWQQQHARDAYQRWRQGAFAPRLHKPLRIAAINWGAAGFTAPGSPLVCDYYDAAQGFALLDEAHAAIYALSVLDRVPAPMTILRACHRSLVPGGLLVATIALWDATGPDEAIGHELRQRIYDRASWRKLLHDVRQIGLSPYGGVDLRYPGDTLGDHTLAAITLTKEA